jgi:lipocalin-like protein
MKKAVAYIFPILLIVIIIGSCKKEGPTTPAGMIQGKWKLAEVGTDDNNDGVIETSEIKPINSEENDEYMYSGNGTGIGSYTYNGNVEPNQVFAWSIRDNDTLQMDYTAHDTLTYLIAKLNASDLTLIENTPQGLVGMYFIKK